MNLQKVLSGSLGYFVVVYLLFLLLFVNWGWSDVTYPGNFLPTSELNTAAVIAAGVFIWFLSPAGILTFAAGAWWKRCNFFLSHQLAAVGEMVAMLLWVSVITIALAAYADTQFYHILNINVLFLHWLLSSGFVFGGGVIVHIARRKAREPQMTLREKMRVEWKKVRASKSDDRSVHAEFCGGDNFSCGAGSGEENYYNAYVHGGDYTYRSDNFKNRAKDRLKRNLKEFISDEIDRRI